MFASLVSSVSTAGVITDLLGASHSLHEEEKW